MAKQSNYLSKIKAIFLFLALCTTGVSCSQNSSKIKQSLNFAKAHQMDTTITILIDLHQPSGKYRLVVYDHVKDTVLLQGLCAHGSGGGSTAQIPKFSNVKGSNCSSLGKYKIGARSYSNWGINIHYKLHGLEPTNNNAFQRVVVLHSWEGIGNSEVFPSNIAMSWGCPTVSNSVMHQLDKLLKVKTSPVLLWIY